MQEDDVLSAGGIVIDKAAHQATGRRKEPVELSLQGI